jgi:hypothetical protein
MRTLNVEDPTWEAVMRLKLDLKAGSVDEVVKLLLQNHLKEIKAK